MSKTTKQSTKQPLNAVGISHIILPLAVVVGVAVVGVGALVASHASTIGHSTSVAPKSGLRATKAQYGGNMYTVKKGYTPTDGGGKGVWIANTTNGYYVGRAFPGDRIQVVDQRDSCYHITTDCEAWVYGVVFANRQTGSAKGFYTYGWLKKADLAKANIAQISTDAKIKSLEDDVQNRTSLATEFNCDAHTCFGGKKLHVLQCDAKVYYNAVINAENKLVPTDKAGTLHKGDTIYYRYTTPVAYDGRHFAAVLDKDGGIDPETKHNEGTRHGWVYISNACVPTGDARKGGAEYWH